MSNKLYFSLNGIKPQNTYPGGHLTHVTAKEVTGFVNISFASLILNKRGSIEPIWHPNANKIGYCLQGLALVSIRSPSSVETFTVQEGDVFFIPKGYVHHIENINEKETSIIFSLDSSNPEVMYLSKAIDSLSENVFNSTFHTSTDFLKGLKKTKNHDLIKILPPLKNDKKFISSRYKFNVADSDKPVVTKGGYLQLATKTNLPVLEGLGILRFGLNPSGIVEPHWHTNAGELVYIVKGKTRITVLSPDGSINEIEVKGGEGAFAPASHFHNIENIGPDDVEVIAFFTHAEPDYIGIGEVFGSYNNDILASTFNVSPDYFKTFKKPSGPLIIVPV